MHLARAISLLDSSLRAKSGRVSGLEQQIATHTFLKSMFPCRHVWMLSMQHVRACVCNVCVCARWGGGLIPGELVG